jgi:alkylhydroperoxidase/carboxymuconolactone decarboxylase family protein YurZ
MAEDNTNEEDETEDLLARAHRSRGFHLGVHEIMHEGDPEYLQHYQRWLEFANIKTRRLDKKTKQIVHVAVDIARNANPDHIRAHMIAGVKAGVTEEEFFEVASLGFILGGTTSLLLGMEAWRRTFRPDMKPAWELVEEG